MTKNTHAGYKVGVKKTKAKLKKLNTELINKINKLVIDYANKCHELMKEIENNEISKK